MVNASSVGKPFGSFFRVFQSWHVRGKKDEEKSCEVQCGIQNRQVWPLVIYVDGDRSFQSMSSRSKRILNSMARRHCLRLFSRDCHWSSFSIAVTLDLWSWLPVTYLALLHWTCSSFLMFRWVCGSHAAEAYSMMGLTYVLYVAALILRLHLLKLRWSLRKAWVELAFLLMTSMWVLKLRLLSICTPRYFADVTSSRMVLWML